GVADLLLPLACAQRRRVREDHGRGLVHRGLRRLEPGRRLVRVVDQPRGATGEAVGTMFLCHGQIGSATRSWPCVPTMSARVNSPTFNVFDAFSGGSSVTLPSISGASA